MSDEKKYSAREAAVAVLQKAEEILKKSEFLKKADKMRKDDPHPYGTTTGGQSTVAQGIANTAPAGGNAPINPGLASGLAGAFGKNEAPPGEILPKEKVQGEPEKPGNRLESQQSPEKNPKEQAEGNNELAGTTPNQVGQDGKNIPGFDEMRGHLKLAKFIGHMEHKRKTKKAQVL